MNRTLHVLKAPVYRSDLYGRYEILWTDDDNFWWCYLELANKPKYKIWYESVPKLEPNEIFAEVISYHTKLFYK